MVLVECPRDAIQGISHFIPTEKKIEYLQFLIDTEYFDWLDFGSFVSPKAIPQMADTKDVTQALNLDSKKTKLLAIIANEKGAENAAIYDKISYLGYPFSISETFQQRNTNASIAESFERVKNIVNIAQNANKEVVMYISMAFGNPYGDAWNYDLVLEWMAKLKELGIKEFSLADTLGSAKIVDIKKLFELCLAKNKDINIGAHFHSNSLVWQEKVDAAYQAGCRKFDGAILGYGGCPFAEDELVGNIPMEGLLHKYSSLNDEKIKALKNAFLNLIAHD